MKTQSLAAVLVLAAACGGSSPQKETIVKDDTQVKDTDTKPSPTPEELFLADCRSGIESARSMLPAILAVEGARTVENTLEPLNDLMLAVGRSAGSAGLMSEVNPSEKIRDAARTCEQEVSAFATELSLNRPLYDAFVAVDTKGLDADTKRFVEHTLRDFRRAGVDKDEATRSRLKAIDEEMTKLGQDFSKTLAEDVRYIEVASADDLKGLPEDYIKAHKPGENGKIRITTDYPDYIPFMSYADSAEHRKALYIVNRSRGDKTNEATLQTILALRAEKAKILGFAHWADYITADKMIGSAKKASEFITKVAKLAKPRAAKDYAELLKRKQQDFKGAKTVEDYEKNYYENKVKAEKYDFNTQAVRPYFPYAQVEKGLLDITAQIYGVTYEPATDAELWHEDVKSFDVMRDGTKIGRIYLDMHPRDDKYKHAAQFPYREGALGKQLPEGVLVCNFPKPNGDDPGLMEHDDVTTMFHEFGHLMHHVFGGHQKWLRQSGVATEWDFVEAPSQMFEEWAWNHDTLKTFAKHHESGEEIPKEMVDRMRRADKFGLGVQTAQQMFYASISLGFHTADPAKLNQLDEVKRLQKELTPFAYVEGTRFHASFGHLVGYSAIYYTYMWSLVIAKDLLTPFEKNGLMNLEWTGKYRDKILAAGGTKDAAVLVKDFLGRDYSFEAFRKFLEK